MKVSCDYRGDRGIESLRDESFFSPAMFNHGPMVRVAVIFNAAITQ